jgi:type VI secretion system VasD/TssJ family lipoprotein
MRRLSSAFARAESATRSALSARAVLHRVRAASIGRCTLLVLVTALAGCSMFSGTSAKQAVAQVDWSAAEDAILIQVDADEHLNEVGSEPHTLLLGVIQTADADSFRKLTADAAALGIALDSGTKNPAILKMTRYVVQPGGHTILSLDRAAKAKVVGLIAGYYDVQTQTCARLFEIPLAVTNQALFGHDYSAQPQTLGLHLVLGPDAIKTAVRLNPEPPEIVAAQARARANQQIVPLDGGGKEIPLTTSGGPSGNATIQLPN